MINNELMQLIECIYPSHIEKYLLGTGWRLDGSVNEKANIWHRLEVGFYEFEVLQPIKSNLRGYAQRVVEVLDSISEFESRPILLIAKDIVNYSADLIKVRVIHADVEGGSIPLDDGVLLVEKARELLVSSTLSTFNKKRYFSGGRPSEAQGFIDSLRLGQTEVGSFIVSIIAPITYNDEHYQDENKSSLARSITQNLSRSLSAIGSAIEKYEDSGNVISFEEAISKGASANLCDALIGISGVAKSRDFDVSIQLSGIEPDTQSVNKNHEFKANKVPLIEVASEYYKGNYVLNGYSLYGIVIRMQHEPGEEFGVIRASTMVNGAEKNVSFHLPLDKYWEAVHAHESETYVTCNGDLSVTPRSATLLNPQGFRVVGSGDMFDSET